MRETKIYCDHCGKVLDEMHDYVDIDLDIGRDYVKTDLCAECLNKLLKITKHFCSRVYNNEAESLK